MHHSIHNLADFTLMVGEFAAFLLIIIGACHLAIKIMRLGESFIRSWTKTKQLTAVSSPETGELRVIRQGDHVTITNTETEMEHIIASPSSVSPDTKEAIRLLKKAYPSLPEDQRREVTYFIHRMRAQEDLLKRFPTFKTDKHDN